MINLLGSLVGPVTGLLDKFIEDKDQQIIKISFRSKGTFSVDQFAKKNFNG